MGTYTWQFPLPRTHTGILQGNGVIGAMIWGESNVLKVTVGRADFWDHRGGKPWHEGMSYANIRRLLEAGDEAGLRALFEKADIKPGQPARPTVLPVGRIELVFPPELSLISGILETETGRVFVRLQGTDGTGYNLSFTLSMQKPLLHIQFPAGARPLAIRCLPAWHYVGDYLKSISFQEPELFEGEAISGWVQERPADPPLCVGYRLNGQGLWLAADYGRDPSAARLAVLEAINQADTVGIIALRAAAADWWRAYWRTVPQIEIPNERLTFLYEYGLYKFAGLTNPDGVAATLQGPWIEEYQMPPWSSDYHFNINVQMCYWPAYRANLLPHLQPLFNMLTSWHEQLQHNANIFLGIDDGLMLPHAVDDKCTCMGGFWTGSIDHGCTTWVAKMMYDYYLYSRDTEFLRQIAYPFMVGAMRVYEGMLERRNGGLVLPVSVSPEYRGAQMNAWGENASFQLACIHWLCESLLAASTELNLPAEPLWEEISARLPKACFIRPEGKEEIALWQGTPLEESHRHHAHLAGLYPFDCLDLDDPAWRQIVERSLCRWIAEGMGMWSGWCVPWASILHTRLGNADMAEMLLELWERIFTNEGHGTLHDCQFPGFTLIGANATAAKDKSHEIMQMDAGMGVTAAIMEMLLHTRRGVNYLFAGAPAHWREVSFYNLGTEGGFTVSASRSNGLVQNVSIASNTGGVLRLGNPWPNRAAIMTSGTQQKRLEGPVLSIMLATGETCELRCQA